jgi:gluconolactonase
MRKILIAMAALWAALGAGPTAQAASAEIAATGLQFAEGTIFVGQTLYFVDYAQSDIYRLEGARAQRVWHQDNCGANGLAQVPDGLLVACYDSGTVLRVGLDGRTLGTLSRDSAGKPFDRPNDLAADAKGNVYFTASGSEGGELGKVYLLGPDGIAREVAHGIHNANGLVVTPDGKGLYLAESGTDKIFRFDIAADGSLSNQRPFLELDSVLADTPGKRHTPDGVRIDKQGRLFIGLYNGGGFAIFGSDGKLLKKVELPGQHHANLALTPDEAYVYGTIANDAPGASGALYRIRNPLAE